MKQFKQQAAALLASALEKPADDLLEQLARPPKADLGDLAFPCFLLAKEKRMAPPAIAAEVVEKLDNDLPAEVDKVKAVGPYVNFWFSAKAMFSAAIEAARGLTQPIENPPADAPVNDGQQVLTIDFSSPNIAKEFSVAHLRSTALGNTLVRLHQALGWRTIGINHLGDWGTQFGLLINAYRAKGDADELEREPIKHLQKLYVEISQEAKQDESVQEAARQTFRQLEAGDPEIVKLWQLFRDLSLAEFNRIYDLLGVSFDTYEGEAFYNDKIEAVFGRYKEAGLAKEDEGAWIVSLGEDETPILLKKSDGASTYATRDLAALTYRHQQYKFSRNLYCVDARQSKHFAQVFEAYGLLGEDERAMAERSQHVPFGTVTVDGMAMSTREGNVILLEEYIKDMAVRAGEIVREKNAGLSDDECKQLAMQVAIGALVFEFLRREQNHKVDFKRDESLKFEGETGPRLQYLYAARFSSLLRSYPEKTGDAAKPLDSWDDALALLDADLLTTAQDKELAKFIAGLPELLERAAAANSPNLLIAALLEFTDLFNAFYREKQIINPEDPRETETRIAFIYLLKQVMARMLWILGIPAPERM